MLTIGNSACCRPSGPGRISSPVCSSSMPSTCCSRAISSWKMASVSGSSTTSPS